MLPFVTTQGQQLVAHAAERLAHRIRARWPQAAEHDAALLAECLVRLAISYATLPVAPAGMTASSITELLGPSSTARSAPIAQSATGSPESAGLDRTGLSSRYMYVCRIQRGIDISKVGVYVSPTLALRLSAVVW